MQVLGRTKDALLKAPGLLKLRILPIILKIGVPDACEGILSPYIERVTARPIGRRSVGVSQGRKKPFGSLPFGDALRRRSAAYAGTIT